MKCFRIIARIEHEGLLLTTTTLIGHFVDVSHANEMTSWLSSQYPSVEFMTIEDR